MTSVGRRSNKSRNMLLVLMTDSVVLAIASNGNSSRLHLFRSYDHIGPATFLRFPGGPDSAPIWEVARATVAVPYYFKPATILDEKYRDAGAVFNNPSLEAFAEINAIHRPRQNNTEMPKEHKIVALEEATQRQRNKQSQNKAQKHGDPSNAIAVFVSIGSGKRPLPCLRFSKSIPGLKTLGSIHEDEAWAARTYTERTHEEMEKTARDTNTAYYRFNIGEGIGDMRFDKWKTKTLGGKHVNETLDVIERETSRYLREPETERSIQLCAEKVVRFRRGQL